MVLPVGGSSSSREPRRTSWPCWSCSSYLTVPTSAAWLSSRLPTPCPPLPLAFLRLQSCRCPHLRVCCSSHGTQLQERRYWASRARYSPMPASSEMEDPDMIAYLYSAEGSGEALASAAIPSDKTARGELPPGVALRRNRRQYLKPGNDMGTGRSPWSGVRRVSAAKIQRGSVDSLWSSAGRARTWPTSGYPSPQCVGCQLLPLRLDL